MIIEKIQHHLALSFVLVLVFAQSMFFLGSKAAVDAQDNLNAFFINPSPEANIEIGQRLFLQADLYVPEQDNFDLVFFNVSNPSNAYSQNYTAYKVEDSYASSYAWDTTGLLPGDYYLQATAYVYDADGVIVQSYISNPTAINLIEPVVYDQAAEIPGTIQSNFVEITDPIDNQVFNSNQILEIKAHTNVPQSSDIILNISLRDSSQHTVASTTIHNYDGNEIDGRVVAVWQTNDIDISNLESGQYIVSAELGDMSDAGTILELNDNVQITINTVSLNQPEEQTVVLLPDVIGVYPPENERLLSGTVNIELELDREWPSEYELFAGVRSNLSTSIVEIDHSTDIANQINIIWQTDELDALGEPVFDDAVVGGQATGVQYSIVVYAYLPGEGLDENSPYIVIPGFTLDNYPDGVRIDLAEHGMMDSGQYYFQIQTNNQVDSMVGDLVYTGNNVVGIPEISFNNLATNLWMAEVTPDDSMVTGDYILYVTSTIDGVAYGFEQQIYMVIEESVEWPNPANFQFQVPNIDANGYINIRATSNIFGFPIKFYVVDAIDNSIEIDDYPPTRTENGYILTIDTNDLDPGDYRILAKIEKPDDTIWTSNSSNPFNVAGNLPGADIDDPEDVESDTNQNLTEDVESEDIIEEENIEVELIDEATTSEPIIIDENIEPDVVVHFRDKKMYSGEFIIVSSNVELDESPRLGFKSSITPGGDPKSTSKLDSCNKERFVSQNNFEKIKELGHNYCYYFTIPKKSDEGSIDANFVSSEYTIYLSYKYSTKDYPNDNRGAEGFVYQGIELVIDNGDNARGITYNNSTEESDSSKLRGSSRLSFTLSESCQDLRIYDEEDCKHFLALIDDNIDEQCIDANIYEANACEDYLRLKTVEALCQAESIVDTEACKDFMLEKYASTVECKLADITECTTILRDKYFNRLVTNKQKQESIRLATDPILGQVLALDELQNKLLVNKISTKALPLAPVSDVKVLVAKSQEQTVLESVNQLTFRNQAVLIIDTDGDGLSDDMEKYHDTDPNNTDTDGDTYLDGEEVKNGYNPNGEGKLERERSLLDEIARNDAQLEQPKRFSEKVDRDFVIEVSKQENNKVKLAGVAEANTWITIFLYSDLPLVMTTKTDASGNWTYNIQQSLNDGSHKVYVTVNDDTGKIVKQSDPLAFLVKSAQAVTVDQYFDVNEGSALSERSNFFWYYVLGAVLLVLFGIFIIFILHRSKSNNY